jgi:hypothetical protein
MFAMQIISAISGLSLIAKSQQLQNQVEADEQQEILQEKQQALETEMRNNAKNLIVKYNKFINKRWQVSCNSKWFKELSIEAESTVLCKDIVENITKAKQTLNSLEKMLPAPIMTTPQIMKTFIELCELCIEIHCDLKLLNGVNNEEKYTITDKEINFLYDEKLYPKEKILEHGQHTVDLAYSNTLIFSGSSQSNSTQQFKGKLTNATIS